MEPFDQTGKIFWRSRGFSSHTESFQLAGIDVPVAQPVSGLNQHTSFNEGDMGRAVASHTRDSITGFFRFQMKFRSLLRY